MKGLRLAILAIGELCKHLPVRFREYGVRGNQLLAVKSMYSCSEVCVRVGGVNHNHPPRVLHSEKGVCCHHSSSQSYQGLPNFFLPEDHISYYTTVLGPIVSYAIRLFRVMLRSTKPANLS